MGRKRNAGGGQRGEVSPAEALGVDHGTVVPPRVSVLQAMCAAAMPTEQEMGRQDVEMVHMAEASVLQFPTGMSAGFQPHHQQLGAHASSLLRSGHFVRVNNELAKQRRAKEVSRQLPLHKAKEGVQANDSVPQGIMSRNPRPVAEGPSSGESPGGTEVTELPGTVSSGTDDRNGQGKPNRHDKSRQGMKNALKLAKAPNDLKKAKESFRRKFLASATLLAKNAKRGKIMEILKATCGEEYFPLHQESILVVSTALDEAQLQSGDQYIHELKLMHIEAGFDWSAPLERQLFLCKKALKRHRGPEVRAKELQIAELKTEAWENKCTTKGGYTRPAWMYALALSWMLRACEVTELRMSDVEVAFAEKTVGLRIRKSKTDQAARGTLRTLSCCGRQTCTRECPWALAVRVVADRPNGKPEDFLFAVTSGAKRGRAHTAKCWAKELHGDLTGHSARRSGAMFYTRKGMDIQDISFLGRWRSSAVFRYMEEAMQERPMNARVTGTTEKEIKESVVNHTQSMERWTDKLVGGDATQPPTPAPKTPAPGTPGPVLIPNDPEDLGLWATSWTRSKKKVTHVVLKASWQLDLNEWATACGWHFAQRSVKVSLSKSPPTNSHKCVKCEKIRELRDKVPEGAVLAQLVSGDLDQLLPKGSSSRIKPIQNLGQMDPACNAQKNCEGGDLGEGGGFSLHEESSTID